MRPRQVTSTRRFPDTIETIADPPDDGPERAVARSGVAVAAGKDPFVGIETFGRIDLKVFNQAGKLLKSYAVYGYADALAEEGVEVHPTANETYTVRVSGDPEGSVAYLTDVTIWAYPDCRGGPATRCAIAPGQTRKATFGGLNDDEAYVLEAVPGKRYTATLQVANASGTLYFSDLRLVDGRGEVVQTASTGAGPAKRNKAVMKFVMPASGGPYHLQAHPATAYRYRGSFTLNLQQQ